MRILYAILYFLDTLALILLAFYILQKLDTGTSVKNLLPLMGVLLTCIGFLFYFISRYMKVPPRQPRDQRTGKI